MNEVIYIATYCACIQVLHTLAIFTECAGNSPGAYQMAKVNSKKKTPFGIHLLVGWGFVD
jgi:hypothetical protein